MTRVSPVVLAFVLALVPGGRAGWGAAAAQQRAVPAAELITDALDLERDERYEEAAAGFRAALRVDPTNLSALLGLERVLRSSDQLRSIFPQLSRAIARDGRNPLVRAVELRVWAGLRSPDSLAAAAARWMQVAPQSPDPYQGWADGLVRMGRADEAEQVLARGIERVGTAPLLPDVARLAAARGEWMEAGRRWHQAVTAAEAAADAAVESLSQAPEATRNQLRTLLTRTLGDPVARRMAADLELAWGQPGPAWTLLDAALPGDREQAARVLQRFADRTRLLRTPESHTVRGYALEELSGVASGTAQERARVEAARAYADAGDRAAAERMLVRLAADSVRAPTGAASAMVTLIGLLAEQGRVEEAASQLREWAGRMTSEDAANLRVGISWAWLLKGDFLTARTVIADDSTLGSMAVRGWIALFTGDLRNATKSFRAAGPSAGTREQAMQRTQVAGLIQRIEPDSVPEFGRAMHQLARGDTAGGLRQLAMAADSLPPQGGRADVLFYAGQVAAGRSDHARAQPFFEAVLLADPKGPAAPVAEFRLAESYVATGKSPDAIRHLEHLILTYPLSAMVPPARRLLDQMRGRVPGT